MENLINRFLPVFLLFSITIFYVNLYLLTFSQTFVRTQNDILTSPLVTNTHRYLERTGSLHTSSTHSSVFKLRFRKHCLISLA